MDYGEYARINQDGTVETTVPNGEENLVARRAEGFKPVRETPAPEPVEKGYHYERSYHDGQDEIVIEWVLVKDPPRTISKFKLKLAIAQAGLLQQFTALLSQVEVAPGYWGDEAFKDASTLDEDHPKFKDAVRLVKTQFGMTDEQVEAILAASVAD